MNSGSTSSNFTASQAREPEESTGAVSAASRRHSPLTQTTILPRPLPLPCVKCAADYAALSASLLTYRDK